jgi:hypothetical protein
VIFACNLTLRVNYDLKMAIKKTPEVKSKANVLLILSIFLSTFRKKNSNLTPHLRFLSFFRVV